ncbi:MAG: acetate--CoA ligase family protein [Candidatus Moranbacteria bacterium]|nr:acetate--CoA ligase family protein [Candidatus Moranbacteria bacterium]
MRELKQREIKQYHPGSQSILNAAFKRKVRVYKLLKNERIFILKKGTKTVWFRGPRLSVSNPVSLWLVKDKFLTKEILKEVGIPFPKGISVTTAEEAAGAAARIGYPVVVKPRSHEGGKGVFLDIRSPEAVKKFFKHALKYDKNILVEKQVFGKYYRITLVSNKVAGILETESICLIGDGKNTAKNLIKKYEKDTGNTSVITNKTKDILLFQGLKLNSVPKKNKKFIISFSGADGGEWIDRTDEISRENKNLLIKLSKYLDLNVVSVDLIASDISRPITSPASPGYLLEINGAPEFVFHLKPTKGKVRDIGEEMIKALFD